MYLYTLVNKCDKINDAMSLFSCTHLFYRNRIGGVMVSLLALSSIDRGVEPRSSQTKDHKIGICCVSAKHATLRRSVIFSEYSDFLQ
jgi:hypothetical protein